MTAHPSTRTARIASVPEGWTIYDEHGEPAPEGSWAAAGSHPLACPLYEPSKDGLVVHVETVDLDRQGVLDLIGTLTRCLETADHAHQSHGWAWARFDTE
ncbi:hypothetical protein GMA12_11895 [Kocuria sediminis]|uniref:Uncharacterized protein n=1 Tax=Kocuria sediminis TaxID=1038857 RepID=A0A6N8GNG8_9MICC|nr:hypothetical protein [Kocuria sediminis]MUN63830.1 hypothetical protein [Kocuria sediminis]